MTQEEKQLLLQDLCGRLSYGIFVSIEQYDGTKICRKVRGIIDMKKFYVDGDDLASESFDLSDYRPYLRPMSSMTEEERRTIEASIENKCRQYWELILSSTEKSGYYYNCGFSLDSIDNMVKLLNGYHFDYRGLIGKGLAIEVTKENNPYKV